MKQQQRFRLDLSAAVSHWSFLHEDESRVYEFVNPSTDTYRTHFASQKAPLSTTQHHNLQNYALSFQQLTMILNRLADWKAALKRPASAVRSRLWPPSL
jgi:hypothetical protein